MTVFLEIYDSHCPPWSLYNSNCVQICMSSACHFPRNNLPYARCDLGECDSYSEPFIIHPTHTVSYLSLCLHTPKTLQQSDCQHVTAKHKFPMYLRVWTAQILTEIYFGYEAYWSLWWVCFFPLAKSNSSRIRPNLECQINPKQLCPWHCCPAVKMTNNGN